MRWLKWLNSQMRLRIRQQNREARRRYRPLIVEQFEERRVLATAVDDSYSLEPDTTLTVNGYGTWTNDSYNQSWDAWGCINMQWQEEYWENPVWYEGYYDENNEWHEGYWSPPEPVWHEDQWACVEEGWSTNHASSSIVSAPSNGTLMQIDTGEY